MLSNTIEENKVKRSYNCGENNSQWKGGKYPDIDGYVLIYSPNHPYRDYKNRVRQHRLIYENYLSIIFDDELYLNPIEEIHHIDGNPQNNSLINLMYFPSHSEHQKYEQTIDMSKRFCLLCGSKETYIDKKNGRPVWHKYKDGFICRNCNNKLPEVNKQRKDAIRRYRLRQKLKK